jgi:hypothetical protein
MDLRGLIGRTVEGVELAYDQAEPDRVVGVTVRLDDGEELSVAADTVWQPAELAGAGRVHPCLRIVVKANKA